MLACVPGRRQQGEQIPATSEKYFQQIVQVGSLDSRFLLNFCEADFARLSFVAPFFKMYIDRRMLINAKGSTPMNDLSHDHLIKPAFLPPFYIP